MSSKLQSENDDKIDRQEQKFIRQITANYMIAIVYQDLNGVKI